MILNGKETQTHRITKYKLALVESQLQEDSSFPWPLGHPEQNKQKLKNKQKADKQRQLE